MEPNPNRQRIDGTGNSMSVKVFISSRISEFAEERARIAQLLTEEMGLYPVYFEGEPAGGHLPNWWRRKIAESDVYLLLLGEILSWPVADELLSAKRLARPIIVLTNEPKLLLEQRIRVIKSEYWIREDEEVKELYGFLLNQKWKEFQNLEVLENEVRDGIAKYLRVQSGITLEIVVDWDSIEKIRAVFVEPRQYSSAQEMIRKSNLTVLCGPPHIGKTSTALRLLGEHLESNRIVTVVELRNTSDLAIVKGMRGVGIFLDDVFGDIQPDVENYANRWKELEVIAEQNTVVATSRTEVLEAVYSQTKLAKRVVQEQTIWLDEESYSEADRVRIVEKHILYWESKGRVFPGREVLFGNSLYIARRLHFPHNIAYLIEFHGPVIKSDKELRERVNESKVIEEEIAKWINRLDREVRLFVIVVAIFERVKEEALIYAYEEICKLLGVAKISLGEISAVINLYMNCTDKWKFHHSSYRLAVLRRAYEMYGKELISYIRTVAFGSASNRLMASKAKKTLGLLGVYQPIVALHEFRLLSEPSGQLDKDGLVAIRQIGRLYPYETLEELLTWPSSRSVHRLVGGVVYELQANRPIEEADRWVPLMKKGVAHYDQAIRLRIAPLIHRLASRKPEEALSIINSILKDEFPTIRAIGVHALKGLGDRAPSKVPIVLEILRGMRKDPDKSVRKYVYVRIAKIEDKLKKHKMKELED